jgi:hypothetical protein
MGFAPVGFDGTKFLGRVNPRSRARNIFIGLVYQKKIGRSLFVIGENI